MGFVIWQLNLQQSSVVVVVIPLIVVTINAGTQDAVKITAGVA